MTRNAIIAAWLLACAGCVHAPPSIETTVRRVDTPAGIAELGRELGPEGWRIVSVTPLRDGWAYVVVLQREAWP